MPDDGGVPVEQVVTELTSEPLGKALWERAVHVVLSKMLTARVSELENRLAPTEPPSPGWDVPSVDG